MRLNNSPMVGNPGGEVTDQVNDSVPDKLGSPSSVAVTVTVKDPGAVAAPLMTQVLDEKLAPGGSPLTETVTASSSGSVALTWIECTSFSSVVRSAMGATTGGRFTSPMVHTNVT